jgi:hypothetical protein
MAVDVGVFAVALAVWTFGLGLSDSGWAVVPLLGIAVLAHVVQMAFAVAVRLDGEGITIIRPWRRRRIAWTQVSGLVYTCRPTSDPGRDPYRLRLVLAGHEPPYGRYLPDSALERYARRGPVVMTAGTLTPDPEAERRGVRRAARCQERVLTALEERGLARPAPRALAFRIRGVDPEQADRAAAADFLRARDAARTPPDREPT